MKTDFSDLLRMYRKSMGWTQEEMAQKWSYSFETISAWERGKRSPSSQEIPRLAKFLEKHPEELASIIMNNRMQPLSKNSSVSPIETRKDWKANFQTWGELQHIYRNRTEFNQEFSYSKMFEGAHSILAAGISLNAIALTYSRDALVKAVVEENCKIQLCFLDPDGKRCIEREEEEGYIKGTLSNLTRVNITLMTVVYNIVAKTNIEKSQQLEIRIYDMTPRFNIYIVDDTIMTVQSYAYGRGEDTPTLVLKRKMQGGLFDFYVSTAKYILEHSINMSGNTIRETLSNEHEGNPNTPRYP